MHKEILSKNQIELLPLLKLFKREFYLVGGTAIALHLGHRRSIDFDLFKSGKLVVNRIINKISLFDTNFKITRRVDEQINLIVNNVNFTFFEYPYSVDVNCKFEDVIKLPDLLNLAAMKAFALGRRSKWKDYVDLFFILRDHHSIKEIIEIANKIYGQLFSEKLFRAQLCYFEDVDFSEEIEYLVNKPKYEEIKKFLLEQSLDI